jgi:CHAD domain-containing protein
MHSKSITESKCKEFIAEELSEIRRLHLAAPTDSALHQIRKHLKRVYYTSQILVEAGINIDKYCFQLSRMDDLQEDLGRMNDLANFYLLLRELNTKTPEFPDIEWIVGVERTKVRNSLINKLKAFDI